MTSPTNRRTSATRTATKTKTKTRTKNQLNRRRPRKRPARSERAGAYSRRLHRKDERQATNGKHGNAEVNRRRLRTALQLERLVRRPRPAARQGTRHRRLPAGVAGRDRAADGGRADRDRERGYVSALRRGSQPPRPERVRRRGAAGDHLQHDRGRRRGQ